MDVHHVGEFADGGVLAHQYRNFLDDIGSMRAIGMTAKNQTIVSGNEEFEQPFGLIHGERLTVSSPEGLLTDKSNTLLLQLVFRGTDTSGFGRGKDGGRHDVETNTINFTI